MFWSEPGREFLEKYPQFRGHRLHMVDSDIYKLVQLRIQYPLMSKSELARRTGLSRPSVRKLIRILEG